MIKDKEVWRDIAGYEGLYEVSSHGRVKALYKEIEYICGKIVSYPEKIMRTSYEKEGYKIVNLTSDGVQCQYRVHRLVALAFIPNDDNLPHINHIDESKDNNHVDNLEWCTPFENANHGTAIIRRAMSNSIPVVKMDLGGKVMRRYSSAAQAVIDGYDNSAIGKCCKGMQRTHKGYKWEYDTKGG